MGFAWKESLSTGVPDIDSQHHELLTRISNVLESCNSNEKAEEIDKHLTYLRDYTAFHFASEEQEMIAHRYPGFTAHKAEHEQFRMQVNDLYRTYTEHGASTAVVVMTIRSSGEWLLQHICKTDKAMVAFLNEHKAA